MIFFKANVFLFFFFDVIGYKTLGKDCEIL